MTPRRTPAPHPERGVDGTPDAGSAVPDPSAPFAPRQPANVPRAVRQNVLAAQRPVPVPGRGDRDGDGATPPAPPPGPPAGAPRRFSPRNWRVRSRLVVLVLVPLIATVGLAANRIATQVGQVRTYDNAHILAETANPLGTLIDAVQDERDLTVQYMSARNAGEGDAQLTPLAAAMNKSYEATRNATTAIDPIFRKIVGDTSYPAEMRKALNEANAQNSAIKPLHTVAQKPYSEAKDVFRQYNDVLASFVALHDFVAAGTSDEEFITDASVLAKLTQLNETVAEERGFVVMTLTGPPDTAHAQQNYKALQALASQRLTAKADFDTLAGSSPIAQLFDDQVTGPDRSNAEATLLAVTSQLSGDKSGVLPPNEALAYTQLDALVDQYKAVRDTQVATLVARAKKLSDQAQTTMYLNIGVIIGIVALATIGTLLIARSLVRPLRVLQNTALEIAGSRLPEMVRRLRDANGDEAIEPITPIALSTTDEVGQVARAFDEVHREAVRLATEQAMLRNNVNAMFVNLSRRSQSLVQRQLRLIDELENSEQDPDQLSSLFKLDHLATRMRRNGENLLVLAGEEPGRRWSQPVPLLDVLRAAASEVEQYERVNLRDLPVVEAAGRTVNDLVHLVAELLENATSFSAPETKISVTGNLLNTGGVMLEIEDSGIGMTPEELDDANERLANPPVVDVAISRRMGLFVVGRLATRHGIQVRLRRSATGGITALVLVPAALLAGNLVDAGRPGLPGRQGSELTDTGQQPALTSTGLPRRPGATRQEPPRALPAGSGGGDSAGLVDELPPPPPMTPFEDTDHVPSLDGAGDGWEDLSPAAPPYRGSTPPGLAELLAETEAMSTGMIPVIRDDMPPPPMTVVDDVPPGFGASPFDTPFDTPFGAPLSASGSFQDSAPPPPFGAPVSGAGSFQDSAPPPPFGGALDGSLSGTASYETPYDTSYDTPLSATGSFDRPSFDTGSFDRPAFDLNQGSEELDAPVAAALDNSATYDFRPPTRDGGPDSSDGANTGGYQISAGSGDLQLNFRVPAQTPPGSPVVPPNIAAPLSMPVPPVSPDAGYDEAPPPRRLSEMSASFDDLLPNLPVDQTGEFPAYTGSYSEPPPYGEPIAYQDFADPNADSADDLLLPMSSLTGLDPLAGTLSNGAVDPLTVPFEAIDQASEPDSSPIFNAIESEWFRERAAANTATPALELAPGAPAPEPARPVVPGPRSEAATAGRAASPLSDATGPTEAARPTEPVHADISAAAAAASAVASSSPTDTAPKPGAPSADEESKESMNNGDTSSSAWQSPGDDGWRAAEAAKKPVAAGLTPKGLPKRVPRSNLVPGSADGAGAAKATPMPIPERSAEAVRSRLASFHQGLRQGRDAATQDPPGTTLSSGSDGSAVGSDSEPGKQD